MRYTQFLETGYFVQRVVLAVQVVFKHVHVTDHDFNTVGLRAPDVGDTTVSDFDE